MVTCIEACTREGIHPRRLNSKEVSTSHRVKTYSFFVADGTKDLSGELEGEPGEFQPTESTDDAEARPTFGRFKVTSSITNEPRVQFCVPTEETFPIPQGLLIRIWMSCKTVAPMIIGMSMDQEICLIVGQVSLSLLF